MPVGGGIAKAFSELERFPALSESLERIIALTEQPNVEPGDLVAAVESDPAVALAVLRAANAGVPSRERLDTALDATERLGTEAVRQLAVGTESFEFFEPTRDWNLAPPKFRLHGLATQQAAARVAAEILHPHPGRLALSSLLHDVGKLVLIRAYRGYAALVHSCSTLQPEQQLQSERRELGLDHALVGGVMLRRWGFPASIASAVERHHDPEAEEDAAIIRVADMLAHYQRGDAVPPAQLLRSASAVGLGPKDLRRLMCDLAIRPSGRPRQVDRCPLSAYQLRVVKQLASGSLSKEIAFALDLSPSTVRSQLCKIYRKLGAADRAQAVLIAHQRGWL